MKRMNRNYMISLATALLLVACGKDETPSGQTNEDMGTNQEDMGESTSDMSPPVDMTPDMAAEPDMGETPDMTVEPDMCTALTECPMNTCGQVEDGCGGVLDCGECACVDGTPTQPTCGACNLGVSRCDENGELSCEMPPLPEGAAEGLDCAEDVLYVDAANQAGIEQGTLQNPYARLSDALAEAETRAAKSEHIVIALTRNDTHTIPVGPEPLKISYFVLPEGVSLIGGFDSAFTYDPERRSRIESSSPTGGMLRGLTKSFLLSGIELEAASPQRPGITSYGLIVRDVSAAALVRNVVVRAANGTDGEAGMDGQNGERGEIGGSAASPVLEQGVPVAAGQGALAPNACPNSSGADGGKGSGFDSGMDGEFGQDNFQGLPGGLGGIYLSDFFSQKHGEDGSDGPDGADGAPGGPPEPHAGELQPGGAWVHNGNGMSGMDGQPGQGGSGGGGAAGYQDGTLGSFPGGSGGGGGAGGCPGTAGTAGRTGGSSIGLLFYNSPGVAFEDEARAYR